MMRFVENVGPFTERLTELQIDGPWLNSTPTPDVVFMGSLQATREAILMGEHRTDRGTIFPSISPRIIGTVIIFIPGDAGGGDFYHHF